MQNAGHQYRKILQLTDIKDLFKSEFLQDPRVLHELNEAFRPTDFKNFKSFINSDFASSNFKAMKAEALDTVLSSSLSQPPREFEFVNSLNLNSDGTISCALSTTPNTLFIAVETPNSETIITSGTGRLDGLAICESKYTPDYELKDNITDFYLDRNNKVRVNHREIIKSDDDILQIG